MEETPVQENEEFDATFFIQEVTDNVDKFLDAANVKSVYGEPTRVGENVVIPSAEVFGILGIGGGSGGGRGAEGTGSGSGIGGGGRVLARPVAAIVITPNDVRVEPIVDITKIWLAGLTAAGFVFAMMARMSRRRLKRGE